MGVEGEGKAGGDERREGMVPAGPRHRLSPRGLLSLPVRRGVWGGGFILVGMHKFVDFKKGLSVVFVFLKFCFVINFLLL